MQGKQLTGCWQDACAPSSTSGLTSTGHIDKSYVANMDWDRVNYGFH
jgi:hypothetical protein